MPTIPILSGDGSAAVEYKIQLAQAVTAISAELADLARNREYYDGDHKLLLSDDQLNFLEGVIGTEGGDWPVDNKCRKVVDKVRARLNVTGWRDGAGGEAEVGDEVKGDTPLGAAIAWWTANDMDRWEGEVYRAALRDGEAYLLVDHDGQKPRFTFAQRYDGQSGMRMRYVDEANTRALFAVKYWQDIDSATADTQATTQTRTHTETRVSPWQTGISALGIARATIYTSSAVYKYARLATPAQHARYVVAGPDLPDGWIPIQDIGDPTWPLPWVDRQGRPLGLAVVPFVSPRGSLVAHVIGLNNALNKTNLDLLSLADQQGFGNLVAEYTDGLPSASSTGTEVDPAADGYGMRPGRVIEIAKGSLKKLPADDLAGLLAYARHLTVSIASNSDIPLHEFVPVTGEVPSGAALAMLDSALSMQADECVTWFTAAWRTAMNLAQALAREYGGLTTEPVTLTPIWADTSYVDPTSEEANRTAMAARVKTLVEAGVPVEVALRREGWTDEDLAELDKAKQADAKAAQTSLASALAAQQRAFDAGQQGPVMTQAQAQSPAVMPGNGVAK